MWETAFDPSMLFDSKIIVNCPSEDLVEELMNLLAGCGVTWCGGGEIPSKDGSRWENHREETCYWIEGYKMTYESKQFADEDYDEEFENHIRCTFYGIVEDSFEPATNEELTAFLGI